MCQTAISTIDNVADWFLAKAPMSPKKLQKMLYYAYSWTLSLTNDDSSNLQNRLFDDEFEAWVHGPVNRHIYEEYRDHGFQDIVKNVQNIQQFPEEIEDILNQVVEVYGNYTGNQLESITHQENPWKNARKGYGPLDHCEEVIDDQSIYNCYASRVTG